MTTSSSSTAESFAGFTKFLESLSQEELEDCIVTTITGQVNHEDYCVLLAIVL